MSKETVENTKVKKAIQLAQDEITERFKKFIEAEYIEEVPKIAERTEQVLEEFAKFKDEKEASVFPISKKELKALTTIFEQYLDDTSKSVSDSEKYITLYEKLYGGDDIELSSQDLQYIGELFSGCIFTTIKEAKNVRKLQNSIKELYQAQYLNSQSITWAAETVQKIQGVYQMEGLPKEGEQEKIITEEKTSEE